MTIFWIMTGLMTALAGLIVLAAARRGAVAETVVDRQAAGAELAELDRLKARGLLDEAAYVAARAEAGRRLLAARRDAREPVVGPRDRYWVLGAIGLTAVVSLGTYSLVGAPGYGDQTYEARVSDWAASPEALEPAQVAAVMDRVVAENPDNPRALQLLGASRFEAGDFIGAASALRRVLAIQPQDAESWARLGESLVEANQGVIGADAEAAFRRAVALDANQFGARYFLGDLALKAGDGEAAQQWWGPVIDSLSLADPRRADLLKRLNP